MIDLSKLGPLIQQVVTLGSIGGNGLQTAIALVAQFKAVLASQGYESDTSELEKVIADASRRQAIAAKEKEAEA